MLLRRRYVSQLSADCGLRNWDQGIGELREWELGGSLEAMRKRYRIDLPNGHVLELGERTLVVGVLNVTPDSFSDGGTHSDPARAVDHALQMEAEGADIIEIGGESTRP